ncbi:hypothetical protein F5B22DRAFT_662043 [Xylaria bambusicola]|uniref:uncharacterized protein n=1 Tax=Xylaria bambusicola TaxID=326684 RepID=UPI002008EA2F|nr:uncharacterized protein F5B22DRAFT_662043 [Xylaria bambusicola]KAI0521714.1 hypothetical protein F5B22DRAFT_662043 [Xylaria bambusicola]
MAQVVLQRACDRFRNELSSEDANLIITTRRFDEVKNAVLQVEQQLAARQELRNFDRLAPFLDTIETYSKALEVACNGTPYLPWIWAPIKLIIQAVHESVHALDKILVAYGNIATSMPRLSRFAGSFPNDEQFQQLIAFLFEDIIEFHRKAYALIRMPGWKFFFSSAWGRFEHRFSGLLERMARIGDLIEREAVALDIFHAAEWRKTEGENAYKRERQRHAEQRQAVLDWLTPNDIEEAKLDVLNGRCYEGTSSWITQNHKFRTWLQRGRGNSVLWLHGKPGSGKSVISSQVIRFLRINQRPVCFFICDYHTPGESAITQILRTICAQIVRSSEYCVPYLYEEFLSQAKILSVNVLKSLLPQLIQHFDDLRIIIDGIDELSTSVHRPLIKELLFLTGHRQEKCRLLIVSQDLPSISSELSRIPRLSLNEERSSIEKDLSLIVQARLQEIDDTYQGALGVDTILSIKNDILAKAEGMFLWVHLILELLSTASNLSELRMQIDNLPADLAEAYKKILHNISNRCSSNDFSKIKRIFSWIMYRKGRHPLRKCQLRVAMILNSDCQIMTRETRPFPNATDICKPFVEDGPGGSLIFVHSSVPQFLLDQSSGPFMQAPESHLSLASACLSQITQSLEILCPDNRNPSPARYAATVGGFYALLPYASMYWMDHVLDCLDGAQFDEILDQIKRLCQKLRQFTSLSSHSNEILEATDDLDPRLTTIISREEAALIRQSWPMKQQEALTSDQHSQPQHLHEAVKHYHETVHFLMSQGQVHGILQQELLGFKEEFGPTAFVCNHHGCERVAVGFSSKAELADHQAHHNGDLKCSVHGCAYNDVGFRTTKDLQAHRRKRHGAALTKRVPKRFREADPAPILIPDDVAKSPIEDINAVASGNNFYKETPPPPQIPAAHELPRSQLTVHNNSAMDKVHHQYQMQLKLREQENKKRLMMARQEQNDRAPASLVDMGYLSAQRDLMLLEQQNKKRLMMERQEQNDMAPVSLVDMEYPSAQIELGLLEQQNKKRLLMVARSSTDAEPPRTLAASPGHSEPILTVNNSLDTATHQVASPNAARRDYGMQLMRFREQQNKKRLMMARRE